MANNLAEPIQYLALCIGGIQSLVAKDIADVLGDVDVDGIELFGSDGPGCGGSGKLLFCTCESPAQLVTKIRSIQALYAVVGFMRHGLGQLGGASKLSKESRRKSRRKMKKLRIKEEQEASDSVVENRTSLLETPSITVTSTSDNTQVPDGIVVEPGVVHAFNGLDQLSALVTSDTATWEQAKRAWCLRFNQPSCTGKHVRFRCSAIRSGQHTYRSQQIAGVVGGACQEINDWAIDLTDFTLEVLVVVNNDEAVVGISMQDPSYNSANGRPPAEVRMQQVGHEVAKVTLRPSAAYVLGKLANIKYGDIVLDPMCGVGTIPLYSTKWWFDTLGVTGIGGDISETSVVSGGVTLSNSQELMATLCVWDAMSLPLRHESVDCIISDLPFGVVCGTSNRNARVFSKAIPECLRVLKCGGKAVFLSALVKVVKNAIEKCNFANSTYTWHVDEEYRVNIGGISNVGLFVLTKVEKCSK